MTAGKRVLIIDDDDNARQALRALLEEEGFVVRTAIDGISALAQLGAFPADIVITDVRMPRMDGRAFHDAVRELPGLHPKFIFISAGPRPDETTPYLEKPIEFADLLALMHA